MKHDKMNKRHLMAAETFCYSYANYADHLGINVRFDKYMPRDVGILERAEIDKWGLPKLAERLKVDVDTAASIYENYLKAKKVVYAKNAVQSFKEAVSHSIKYALEQGLETEKDIEKLVGQIGYRASDLACLLELEKRSLSDYSFELRQFDKGDGYVGFEES